MNIFPVLNRAEIHEKYSKMLCCEVYREVWMTQPLYFYLFLPGFSMKKILLLSIVGTFTNSVFPSQGAMFYSLPLIKIWQQVRKRGLQFFYIIVCVQILQNGELAWANCIKMVQEKRSWTEGVSEERNIDEKSLLFNHPPFVLTCRYPWFAEGISQCCVELLWALLSVPLDGALSHCHMSPQPFLVHVCMRESTRF